MQIRLLRGRAFSPSDEPSGPTVVVINRTMAERHWPESDADGRRIHIGRGGSVREATIVGVVEDTVHLFKSDRPGPVVYTSRLQDPGRRNFLVVRSDGPPGELTGSVREAIWSVDDALPVRDVRTMEQVVGESLLPWRGAALGLGIFAALALLLAALGIYAVVAFTAGRRTREIGIRIALGARRDDVVRLVVGQGMIQVAVGVLVGTIAAVALNRTLDSLPYGVGAADPLVVGGVAFGTLGIAALASYLPARRATRIDPVEALADR